jgi:RNA polymerase sigma factor (TIGR02999 family)
MNEVTRILDAMEQGDPHAADGLLPLVYDELRRLAAAQMAREKPGQTLNGTALVHEAYVRLVGGDKAQYWNSRGHFFAAAAEAMRRILVESARRKARRKRGGEARRVELSDNLPAPAAPIEDVLAVNEALDRLAARDPTAAELVKLHYFAGMTLEAAADVLGVPHRTAYRDWAFARAWLARILGGSED